MKNKSEDSKKSKTIKPKDDTVLSHSKEDKPETRKESLEKKTNQKPRDNA